MFFFSEKRGLFGVRVDEWGRFGIVPPPDGDSGNPGLNSFLPQFEKNPRLRSTTL